MVLLLDIWHRQILLFITIILLHLLSFGRYTFFVKCCHLSQCHVAGPHSPRALPNHPEAGDDREAPGPMPPPRAAQWRPPEGSRDIRHHLQMYRHAASGGRPVHLQRGTVPTARLLGDERQASVVVAVREPLCAPRAAHSPRHDGDTTRTAPWAGGCVGAS